MSLSNSDLKQFSDLLDSSLERKLSPLKDQIGTLATKEEITGLRRMIIALPTNHHLIKLKEELLAKISHLPTKEPFYKKMDKWMKGTTTHNLEKSAHKHAHERLSDHLSFPHTMKMV